MLPNDYVKPSAEDLQKFKDMLDLLDDCQDVQAVYHNCDMSEE